MEGKTLHLWDYLLSISVTSDQLKSWKYISIILIVQLLDCKNISEVKMYLLQFSEELADIRYSPRRGRVSEKIQEEVYKLRRVKSRDKAELIKETISLVHGSFAEILESTYNARFKSEPDSQKYFTITEAATNLGVTNRTIRNYIEADKLQTIRDQNERIRIPESSIQNFLRLKK